MMSILERKFPPEAERDDLRVELNDAATVTLTDDWYVMARRQVLLSWQGEKMPAFSPNVRLLAFEDVVAEFGGEQPFNQMVKQSLDFNDYAEWGVGD